MSLRQDLKDEFRLEKLKLGKCQRCNMYRSQWWDVGVPLLIWRLLIALGSLVIVIFALSNGPVQTGDRTVSQVAYFTIWSFIMLTVYFVTSAIISVYSMCKDRYVSKNTLSVTAQNEETGFTGEPNNLSTDELRLPDVRNRAGGESIGNETEDLPWYMKIQWILYNIALPNAILVTLIYWSILYPMLMNYNGYKTNGFDVCIHGLNSVSMIVEQYLSAIPTRLLHVIHPMIYAICYGIFSGILYGTEKIVLYPYVLDWSQPGITVGSLCGILVFFTVTQFILFLLYRAQEKCCRGRA